VLERAGASPEGLLEALAAAFAKGSTRRSPNAAPSPPPILPSQLAPHFAALRGAALLEAAEKAAALVARGKERSESPVPELPLFGALEASGLRALLSCFALRELDAGATVVRQGDAGQEAFVIVRGLCEARRESGDGSTVLATLGAGAMFGEMSLVSDAPRAASVIALEPTLLLVAERAALEAVALHEPAIGRALGRHCEDRMLANLVRHSSVLSSLPPAQRGELIARFERRSLVRGDRLVQQGQDADGLYLLASGQVQVRAKDESGEATVLAQLGAGEVVGEISLVLRRPATADVIALSPTIALVLPRDAFHDAVRAHPTLLRDLYELAVKRDEELQSVVAQESIDASDLVLL
jgi:cAMP-dependent protein kinase regulator